MPGIALDKLFDFYKFLMGVTMEFQKLQKEAVRFLNRSLYSDYVLNSEEGDPYALKTMPVMWNSHIKTLLTDIWFKANLDKSLCIEMGLPVAALLNVLNASFESSLIRVGRGIPSGDDALYVAWQIYPEVRDNIYLVIMHTARYGDTHMFFLEGDVNSFFSPDSIGLIGGKTIPADADYLEEVKGKKQQIIAVNKKINIFDLGSLFNDLRGKGII